MTQRTQPNPIKKICLHPSLDIAYTEVGEGPKSIVFIHGLGSNHKAWQKNIDYLESGYHCISIDLPGYGSSSPGPFPFSMEFYATKVQQFINTLGLRQVTIAGHSMGGQIALHIAATKPFWLEKIVLAAPAGFEAFSQHEMIWLSNFFSPDVLMNLSDYQIEKNVEANFFNMPADARFMVTDRIDLKKDKYRFPIYCKMVGENVKAMVYEPVYQLFKNIDIPVLILFGEEDRLIPNRLLHPFSSLREIAAYGAKQLRYSKLIFFSQCGHFLQWEAATRFNREMVSFLEEK